MIEIWIAHFKCDWCKKAYPTDNIRKKHISVCSWRKNNSHRYDIRNEILQKKIQNKYSQNIDENGGEHEIVENEIELTVEPLEEDQDFPDDSLEWINTGNPDDQR